jgi:hypothetical protein
MFSIANFFKGYFNKFRYVYYRRVAKISNAKQVFDEILGSYFYKGVFNSLSNENFFYECLSNEKFLSESLSNEKFLSESFTDAKYVFFSSNYLPYYDLNGRLLFSGKKLPKSIKNLLNFDIV